MKLSVIKKPLKVAEILISIVIIIAAIGLFGWITNDLFFAQISELYIPIAPSTAVSFTVLSIVLLLLIKRPEIKIIRSICIGLLVISIVFFSIIIIDYIFTFPWDIEEIFIHNPERFGEVVKGRMSPLTAILFILESGVVLLQYFKKSTIRNHISSGFTIISLFISSVLLIGYLYNTPLLYGGSTIPVALQTAICFWLLSIALIYINGTRFSSFTWFAPHSIEGRLFKSFFPFIIFLLILNNYLGANIIIKAQNPALTFALVLIIAIPLFIVLIYYISKSLGGSIKRVTRELEEAKSLVEKNERELQKAQEITHTGNWYIDILSYNVVWSKELYKMLGFDPNLPPPPFSKHKQLFTAESWKTLSVAISATAQKGQPYELELQTIRNDGSTGWLWVLGEAVFDDKKNIIGLWGAAQDISERKYMELELLKAKEKAEESDQLKSAFLANMSHEIRTPMNGILGFADLLKEPKLKGEEMQKYIGIIEKSGARMLNIINNIIDIAKIESGQMEVFDNPINIYEQCDYIYHFFLPEATAKNIELRLHIDLSRTDATIITDKEKLLAILINLIKNAIKYTKKGSIEIGVTKKDNTLNFSVKDTGIGIPSNRKAAIFERFIQADIHNTSAYEGAGLGLSISRAFVELLGGKIELKSKENAGSEFHFFIPYQRDTNSPIQHIKTIPQEGISLHNKNLKVLVVEDDETSKTLIYEMINHHCKEIHYANSGIEAIEMVRNNQDLDLVLMDIQLPEMNGYTATRQIRKFNKDITIIAQTAYALTGDYEKAIDSGCQDYISKPINKEILFKLINKHRQ